MLLVSLHEGSEFGMAVDGFLELVGIDGEIEVSGTAGLEEGFLSPGQTLQYWARASTSAAGMPPLRWASMS